MTPFDSGCAALPWDNNGDGSPDVVRTLCLGAGEGGLPTGRACSSDSECFSSTCQEGQCTAVCNGGEDCLDGQSCTLIERIGVPTSSYMGCGYAARAGQTTVERVELGESTLVAGRGLEFELALPPDAISLTIQLRYLRGAVRDLAVANVVDPTGTVAFDLGQIFQLVDQPIRWLPADNAADMLIPNTSQDRHRFVGGQYTWVITTVPETETDMAQTDVSVTALIKRAASTAEPGTLDLNVYPVGIAGLSAANAAGNSRLQQTLAGVEAIFAQASVALGTIRYFDVPSSVVTRLSIINSTEGPGSELSELFQLGQSQSNDAIDIFLVRAFEDADGGFGQLGQAGGVPGPNGHGSLHSGVAMAFDTGIIGTGARAPSHIMSHEVGHYLGLYHSTERVRPCATGEFPPVCAPFGGGDVLVDTSLGDTNNLMFWSIQGSGTNGALSSGQGFVMRMNTLTSP